MIIKFDLSDWLGLLGFICLIVGVAGFTLAFAMPRKEKSNDQ